MKRFFIALTAATLMIGTDVATASAVIPPVLTTTYQAQPKTEGRWRGPCSDWWLGENLTPEMWAQDLERGREMIQRLIVCVFGVFAPGESVTALIIADRESSFYPWAANSSGALGLFQHMVGYWPGRAETYLFRGWFAPWMWPISPFDPRANAIVTARMVAESGWGPWS